ncbi:MAG: hypothetical protein ACJ74Y_02025 [Bryobacteraceae bacterium]
MSIENGSTPALAVIILLGSIGSMSIALIRGRQAIFIAALLSAFLSRAAVAQTVYTWIGGGNTSRWFDNANWDVPPDPNGILRFQGSKQTATINDRFNNIFEVVFNSSSDFSISGNPLIFQPYTNISSEIRNIGTGRATLNINLAFFYTVNLATQDTGANVSAINGDIVFNGTVGMTGDVSAITVRGDGHAVTFNGAVSGAGKGLSVSGTNTVTLAAANSFSGGTDISGGKIVAASSGALGQSNGIVVTNSGSLIITGNGNLNRINDAAPISLAGTLARAGSGVVSEGSGASVSGGMVSGMSTSGIGALTLTANSTIDFGSGGVGTFTISSFNANGHTLSILNWTSSASAFTGQSGHDGVDDRLIFSQDESGNLQYFDFNGLAAMQIPLDGGFYEIVAVPEPATYFAGLLTAVAVALARNRRNRNSG